MTEESTDMKKIIIIAVILLTAAISAQAQEINSIYNRYSGKEGVSSVYISPAMFNLMKDLPDVHVSAGDIDFSGIIKTFKGMYILDIENKSLASSLASDIRSAIGSGKYQLLMEATEEDESMQIYIASQGEIVTDLIMLATEKDSVSVIAISAEMTYADLQKLISE